MSAALLLLGSTTGFMGGTTAPVRVGPGGMLTVGNVTTELRDGFETLDTSKWTLTLAAGDLAVCEGNAVAASYLVISKSNLQASTTTKLESVGTVPVPVELTYGVSLSQRPLGIEFAVELGSPDPMTNPPGSLTLSAIQQATTTLTCTTVNPHNMNVGQRFGVAGVQDSRFNYPALVVASVTSPTVFTATAGPGGTIASVTAGPINGQGYIFQRSNIGGSADGASMIFENGTATNATCMIRTNDGDALASGTLVGNQSATIGTTASVQAVNSSYSYTFQPTTEYRLLLQPERIQWIDASVDVTTQPVARYTRSQVVPNPAKHYKVRFRGTANDSACVSVAQIVSAAKTGTTTATVIFDRNHGLTTSDLVTIYGARDQVNFANLTTATAVASIVNPTTITIVWGGAVTATTYGGSVQRVNGGNLASSNGISAIVAQTATLSTLADGANTRQLVLTGNTNWASLSIGDFVDVIGCRDNVAGVSLGVDGPWRVANVATTTLTLTSIASTALSAGTGVATADFGSTNCGGCVWKRSDLRISFVRAMSYQRERIEGVTKGANDSTLTLPVAIQAGNLGTVTSVTTVTTLTGGGAAEDAAGGTSPVMCGGIVRTATAPTTLVAGDACRLTMASNGGLVVTPYGVPDVSWSFAGAIAGLTTGSDTAAKAAGAAGIRNYVTTVQVQNNSATASEFDIKDGATVLARIQCTANMPPTQLKFDPPLRGTAATALNVQAVTAASVVIANLQGFQGT